MLKETWRRGQTEAGMLEILREIRDSHTNVFPFEMYSQLPLTYALLCARLGDLNSAESELDRYISRRRLQPEVALKLKELVREHGQYKT